VLDAVADKHLAQLRAAHSVAGLLFQKQGTIDSKWKILKSTVVFSAILLRDTNEYRASVCLLGPERQTVSRWRVVAFGADNKTVNETSWRTLRRAPE
jgi:hypothetical protein